MSTSLARPTPETTVVNKLSQNGGIASLIASLLAQYIPGYNLLATFVTEKLGLDADKTLAVVGFFFGGWAAVSYLRTTVIPRILESFTSSLIIDPNDSTYEDFTAWIARQKVFHFARLIKIVGDRGDQGFSPTKYASVSGRQALLYSVQGIPRNLVEQEMTNVPDFDENKLFDYATIDAQRPLDFQPFEGRYWFFYRGRLFLVSREKNPMATGPPRRGNFDVYDYDNARNSNHTLRLSCVGVSTQPLKDLIEKARAENFEGRAFRTSIFRPSINSPHVDRHFVEGGGAWSKMGSRVSRRIDTVVLSKDQKLKILKDVNNFFHPKRHEWYAGRGIPYRRGFLFSGPPGTGKTSVCYALAGVFGVDIFVASVGKGSALLESDLINLLSDLPSRCIVVLEDIDCAGASRDDGEESEESDDDGADDIHFNQFAGRPARRRRRSRSQISLSGLLNAIDGTGAHEGHLLVMTTNHPEAIDAALKRPGRVDMHIEFSLASKSQIREIFVRMYSDETTNAPRRRNTTLEDACREPSQLTGERICFHMPVDELLEAANSFADHFQEDLFSPAEVQGLLLMHKGSPQDALREVSEWIPAQLVAREQAKKLAAEAEERRASRKAKMLVKRDEYVARRNEKHMDDMSPHPLAVAGVADLFRRRAKFEDTTAPSMPTRVPKTEGQSDAAVPLLDVVTNGAEEKTAVQAVAETTADAGTVKEKSTESVEKDSKNTACLEWSE